MRLALELVGIAIVLAFMFVVVPLFVFAVTP